MKTLTIRRITPEMKEAIEYYKTLPWGRPTNTKAIEGIIAHWWKTIKPHIK